MLSIWSPIIFKKEFLLKFNNNLNLHPSYLPYNRGKDPYIWSIINETPKGVSVHEMNEKIDSGKYYVRKKFNLKFPYTGQKLYEISLKENYKLFIKNWIKIKNKKILPKNFGKDSKLNLRSDLIKINLLNLDNKQNKVYRKFLLGCIAQDFKTLKQQIKLNNKIYNIKLSLIRSKIKF